MSVRLIPNGPQILCRHCGAVANHMSGLCDQCRPPANTMPCGRPNASREVPRRCGIACEDRPEHVCELRAGHPGSHMWRNYEWYNVGEFA